MKFGTKPIRHYSSRFRHVAWKTKNSNFLQISADMENAKTEVPT